jgi:hypothetical protein
VNPAPEEMIVLVIIVMITAMEPRMKAIHVRASINITLINAKVPVKTKMVATTAVGLQTPRVTP